MSTKCNVPADFEVHLNTDGVFGVFLLKNNAAIPDLSFITRVVLACGTESVDSAVAPPGTIWWTDQGEYLGVTANILNFKLGNTGWSSGIRQGCRITVYDAVNVNGIVYADNLVIDYIAPES